LGGVLCETESLFAGGKTGREVTQGIFARAIRVWAWAVRSLRAVHRGIH
jgi:hypothetical protein